MILDHLATGPFLPRRSRDFWRNAKRLVGDGINIIWHFQHKSTRNPALKAEFINIGRHIAGEPQSFSFPVFVV